MQYLSNKSWVIFAVSSYVMHPSKSTSDKPLLPKMSNRKWKILINTKYSINHVSADIKGLQQKQKKEKKAWLDKVNMKLIITCWQKILFSACVLVLIGWVLLNSTISTSVHEWYQSKQYVGTMHSLSMSHFAIWPNVFKICQSQLGPTYGITDISICQSINQFN